MGDVYKVNTRKIRMCFIYRYELAHQQQQLNTSKECIIISLQLLVSLLFLALNNFFIALIYLTSGQMHWSGAQLVPPNVRKNVLSWALTGTGSAVSIRQVSSQHPASLLCVCAHAYFLFLFGAKVLSCEKSEENCFTKFSDYLCDFVQSFGYITGKVVMSSPSQCRGSCGLMMAGFDTHKKCAGCRDKSINDHPFVKQEVCGIHLLIFNVLCCPLLNTRYVEKRNLVY